MSGVGRGGKVAAACSLALVAAPAVAPSDPLVTDSYTLYGTPGLLEMPTAEMAEDGELAGSYSRVATQQRATLTFQLAPRLSGSFRYTNIPGYELNGTARYDRSFDLRFQMLDEGDWWPAVSIGLQDFIGTGVFSGEYLVATKEIFDGVRVTGGLGWGRLGTANQISDGFGERTGEFTQTGGTANFGELFQGPIGAFGGVSWAYNERLTFKAEYSSDDYAYEQSRGIFEVDTQWNFGVDYEIVPGARITASYLYGNELGLQLNLALNPAARPYGPGSETAPGPVAPRPSRSSNPEAWSQAWATDSTATERLQGALSEALKADGIELEALALAPTTAELRINNERWAANAQAIGRTARIMSRTLPPSVETFVIVPVADGVPNSAAILQRSDVEATENAPAREILSRTRMSSGARPLTDGLKYDPRVYPRLNWEIAPYTELSLFDPDQPVRGDLGLQAVGELGLAPGLVLSAQVRKKLVGNLDQIERESNSVLPRVRSNFKYYLEEGDPRMERLHLSFYSRPGTDLYSRVTAGYLERMYAGVSGEVLWKPVDSRLALGAELNYVQQRDYEGGFGLFDYTVATGHLSAYYDFENGYQAQVDAGRYLAGDYGATLSVDRTFDNGWRVGAYATLTDVPFEDFGEGSFDKGIRIRIPFNWFTGQPTRTYYVTTLSPLTRDGGARLNVAGRLYDRVRDVDGIALEERAGRFWK